MYNLMPAYIYIQSFIVTGTATLSDFRSGSNTEAESTMTEIFPDLLRKQNEDLSGILTILLLLQMTCAQRFNKNDQLGNYDYR